MAKTVTLKPEEAAARAFADRIILEQLTDLYAAVKLSDLVDKLQPHGIGLAAVRALLASNPEKFAYNERRWVPASRVEGEGRSVSEGVRLVLDRFGGPMDFALLNREMAAQRDMEPEEMDPILRRLVDNDRNIFVTAKDQVCLSSFVFAFEDESYDRALGLNRVKAEDVDAVTAKVGAELDWRGKDAIEHALRKAVPVNIKTFGACACKNLNPDDPRSFQLYDWRDFNSQLLCFPGYVVGADGTISTEDDAKKWISAAVKLADKLAPLVDVEDAQPIEVKKADVDKLVAKILKSEHSITATEMLEQSYEITPTVKTFPDDLANLMQALNETGQVWWVGGDRFAKPGAAPDFIEEVPALFEYEDTLNEDEEGELVDVELNDEGLSTTLRKLLSHPLATDVLDEEIMPAPKQLAEQLRLVLKPIHREVGTFPMCQFPTGWISATPKIQELIFRDEGGRELQVWANNEARLLFNLIDWFFEQPVESGAVFSLTRTTKANVFDFAWLDQTDPVVFITSQRMEELRDLQSRSEGMSTLSILQEVMSHWPKGADFLTILWEVNVVRRSTRRLIASLLSSYACFFQRSGSPVWHFDNKKVEQGFDKSKRKFVLK